MTSLDATRTRATVQVDGARVEVRPDGGDPERGLRLDIGGEPAVVRPAVAGRAVETVTVRGRRHRIALAPPPSADALGGEADEPDALSAPMHGRIVRVHVEEGDHVRANAPLLVLEAMKMEHVIAATAPGRVTRLHVATGDQVVRGAPLVDLDALEAG
jgi:acetyl-CoA/propionyl-CoA carboxylase biotin carboxyl carrier protein